MNSPKHLVLIAAAAVRRTQLQPLCFSRRHVERLALPKDQQLFMGIESQKRFLVSNATPEESIKQPNHTTRVLYDGECKLCTVEIAGLKWMARNKSNVEFVDITAPEYDSTLFSGVTYEQAMREMHVVGPDGQVYTQGDAVRQMYRASGLGWLAKVTEVPGVKGVCDRLYVHFAIYRLRKALARCDSESDRCSIKLHRLREKIGDSL